MKETYFNAIEQVIKPFITWQSVGMFTEDEFKNSAYGDDPLIVPESQIPFPYNVFGVCPLKIREGVLENRTPAEMAVFEAEYNIIMGVKAERLKIITLNESSFTYDDHGFPMDEVSRLLYQSLKSNKNDRFLKTINNESYLLLDDNKAYFLDTFYNSFVTILSPTFS